MDVWNNFWGDKQMKINLISAITYAAVIVVSLVYLVPIVWLAISAFFPEACIHDMSSFKSFPINKMTLNNFWQVLVEAPTTGPLTIPPKEFIQTVINTIYFSLGSALLTVSVCSLGAFVLALHRRRLEKVAISFFLLAQLIPWMVTLIPQFIMYIQLGLFDTIQGLILSGTAGSIPLIILILRSYFISIPIELMESALIDGASRLSILFRIVLPLAKPVVASGAIIVFINTWNYYMGPLILSASLNSKTVQVQIAELVGQFSANYSLMCASAVVVILPPVFVAILFQKYIVSGLVAGAVKG